MRVAGRLSRTAFAQIDEKHDHIRRSFGLVPLYGLARSLTVATIGQWGWSDGVLSQDGLAYGLPGRSKPWAEIVTTAGPAEQVVADQRLAIALAADPLRDSDAFQRVVNAAEAEPVGEVTLNVDGLVTPFRFWTQQPMGWQGGVGWFAALDAVPGVVVMASGLEPDEVELVSVADVEPFLVATRERLLAAYDSAPPASQP
jgi:hypothetical protein